MFRFTGRAYWPPRAASALKACCLMLFPFALYATPLFVTRKHTRPHTRPHTHTHTHTHTHARARRDNITENETLCNQHGELGPEDFLLVSLSRSLALSLARSLALLLSALFLSCSLALPDALDHV